jgi:hypothetical protein
MDPAIRAAIDKAINDAKADVAELVQRGAKLLHPNDPQVAKNRAALEAALPSVDEMIAAALSKVKS